MNIKTLTPIQYLDEHSQLTQALPSLFEQTDTLIDLYRLMVQTRLFDEKAIALQRTGQLGTYPSSRGQEALYVGIGHAMQVADVFVPYYRDHGTFLQRGMRMEDILAYWGGCERGSQFPKGSEDMPICVPIATQSCHAAGVAKAIKIRGQKRAVLMTIGEGGTSKGDFYEALNVAGVWQLPLVFVVNNNQWAISTSTAKQSAIASFAEKGAAAGITSIYVDGNDVVAMRELSAKALTRARAGKGPTLIEAVTYRHCDHTTADDATRYQPAGEAEREWLKEPIGRLKNYLMAEKKWSDEKEAELITQCQASIEASVKNYLERAPQTVASIFDHLYESLPPHYEWQRQEADYYAGGHLS